MLNHRTLLLSCLASGLIVGCGDDGGSNDPADTPSADVADAGSDAIGSDTSADADPTDGGADTSEPECVDDEAFFETKLWDDLLGPVCSACHTAQGVARDTSLVFEPAAVPDYLERNREIFADVARLEREGVPLILLKPSGAVAHEGGTVAPEDSAAYALLEEFIERLDEPVECEVQGGGETGLEALELASPAATLRRATLALAGRLPTAAEWAAVEAGGEDALRDALRDVMGEEAFIDRLKEIYNDHLLVRAYESGGDGISLLDENDFPGRYWFEATENGSERNRWRNLSSYAVAHEALELIAFIVREDRPFTEVLTADYTVVNGYSAASYGVWDQAFLVGDDEQGADRWAQARVEDYPHVGVLSMPAVLNRFPTTDTNRNRHRAWVFFRLFLATDILSFADRPIDPTSSTAHNPTLNDGQCTVCHATMDPVAGLFQNWDERGRYRPPEDGWYPSLAPPGYGDTPLPQSRRPDALRWLAEQAVEDARFPLAVTHTIFEALVGVEPRPPVVGANDEEGAVNRDAYRLQRAELERIAAAFVDAEFDLKTVFEEIVLSPYFRAVGAGDAESAAIVDAGPVALLGPEQLNRRIETVVGYPWAGNASSTPYLLGDYELLYGGINSDGIVERAEAPSGIISNIGLRAATDLSCIAVARDFVLRPEDRRLFPFVEVSFKPTTDDGFEVPGAVDAIRENIRYMHYHILGEELAPDSEELEATYTLFRETLEEGAPLVESGELSNQLPWNCRGRSNWYTGEEIPSERQVNYDYDYTVRAWQAVFAYLVTDYRFLYQ